MEIQELEELTAMEMVEIEGGGISKKAKPTLPPQYKTN